MNARTRQLLAAAAFTAIGVAVLGACAVGLALHAVVRCWDRAFGARHDELAGEHVLDESTGGYA